MQAIITRKGSLKADNLPARQKLGGNRRISYAQCWEDADILLSALEIKPGDTCLSIASAGDNTLSMLSRGPRRVIAIDQNPAQLACLELRVAAYRTLAYEEFLLLYGTSPPPEYQLEKQALPHRLPPESLSAKRKDLFRRCRPDLSPAARAFLDRRQDIICRGAGNTGKFEGYFSLFRNVVLPLAHSKSKVSCLLQSRDKMARRQFYEQEWDTWQWRLLFKIFFCREVMGAIGRDRSCFNYVEGDVAARILERAKYALTELDPSDNPYLQWILTGRHQTALPHALRPENFSLIRANLNALQWHCISLQDFLDETDPDSIDKYNLSDVFEYVSLAEYHQMLEKIIRGSKNHARLAYWNMLAPRMAPDTRCSPIRRLESLAQALHAQDRAFFYSSLQVEEIIK